MINNNDAIVDLMILMALGGAALAVACLILGFFIVIGILQYRKYGWTWPESIKKSIEEYTK